MTFSKFTLCTIISLFNLCFVTAEPHFQFHILLKAFITFYVQSTNPCTVPSISTLFSYNEIFTEPMAVYLKNR